MLRFLAIAVSAILVAGCAIAPLTQGGPARPVGAGEWEGGLQWSGYVNDRNNVVLVPSGKVRYGVSSRATLALASEFRTLNFSAQYAYWNEVDSAISAGVEAGLAIAAGEFSYFVGHTLSAHWGNWEPFLGGQFILANLPPGGFDSRFFKGSPDLHPIFFMLAAGTRYWLSDSIAVAAHGNFLVSTASVSFYSPLLPSLAMYLTW